MQPASQESNDRCTCNSKCRCKCTVVLLLFVGFVFGFSIGFATKDTIISTTASWIIENDQPADPAIERLAGSPKNVPPEQPSELQPTPDEDKEKSVEEQPQVNSSE